MTNIVFVLYNSSVIVSGGQKMTEKIIYETLQQPIDLMGDKSAILTAIGRIDPTSAMFAEKALYERRNLFVKSFRILPTNTNNIVVLNPTVFLQDSVERQCSGKIAAFVRRINDVINDAHAMKATKYIQVIPQNWKPTTHTPTITVSIKCDDTTLGLKSQKIISTFNEAIQSGVKIEFINKCSTNSPWSNIINSMLAKQKQY